MLDINFIRENPEKGNKLPRIYVKHFLCLFPLHTANRDLNNFVSAMWFWLF